MKFSIKDFFSKCDQIRDHIQKILNRKLHFFYAAQSSNVNFVIQVTEKYKKYFIKTGSYNNAQFNNFNRKFVESPMNKRFL